MAREMRPQDFITGYKVHQILAKLQPHIIHAHGAKGGAYTRLYRWLFAASRKAKLFYCAHGGSLHYDPKSLKGKIFFTIERFLEKLTDGLIFVCEFEKNTYTAKVGEPTIPYAIIYNGIREEELEPVINAPSPADFVYVGAMRDLKGPDIVINAVKHLKDAFPALKVLLVGDGPDKDRYKETVKEDALEEHIGFADAMPAREAFAKGRAVLLPSRAESFPYIVLEALGAKKPMLANNVGGVSEVFLEESKHLISSPEPEDLARAMEDFMQDDAPALELAEKLHQRVKDNFSIKTMAQAVSDFYFKLDTQKAA